MLNGKSILITGGAGEFGRMFVKKILWDYPDIKRIVIYSRDELKQWDMQQEYPNSKYRMMRYFIGDVRDIDRLKRACEGIDIVVHAAAMSQVDVAEYNPEECIKTNIEGVKNLIDACLAQNVHDVVMLSSDKACAPINLYGATKLTAEKLFIAANNIKGSRNIRFSVVRYGNVMGSRGTVIPSFIKMRNDGAQTLPITDMNMSRFNITNQQSTGLVIWALVHHVGGEIFIPKVPSYHIIDMAKAIAPNLPLKVIGLRSGEKIYEEMITISDAPNTIEVDRYYVIIPTNSVMYARDYYLNRYNGVAVPKDFTYTSENNLEWETVDTLREKIKKYVDPTFVVK